jgi:hypothetical protein
LRGGGAGRQSKREQARGDGLQTHGILPGIVLARMLSWNASLRFPAINHPQRIYFTATYNRIHTIFSASTPIAA